MRSHEQFPRSHVIVDIPADFGAPELLSRRWPAKQRAVVAVPETSVHQNHCSVLRQYNVGATGKSVNVQTKAEACAVKAATDRQLGAGVLGANSSHHAAANITRDIINHQAFGRVS